MEGCESIGRGERTVDESNPRKWMRRKTKSTAGVRTQREKASKREKSKKMFGGPWENEKGIDMRMT